MRKSNIIFDDDKGKGKARLSKHLTFSRISRNCTHRAGNQSSEEAAHDYYEIYTNLGSFKNIAWIFKYTLTHTHTYHQQTIHDFCKVVFVFFFFFLFALLALVRVLFSGSTREIFLANCIMIHLSYYIVRARCNFSVLFDDTCLIYQNIISLS